MSYAWQRALLLGGDGGGGFTGFTLRGYGVTRSASLALPAGAAEGDFAVWFTHGFDEGYGYDFPAIDGWTEDHWSIITIGQDILFQVKSKILTAGDILAGTVNVLDSDDNESVLYVFEPDAPLTTATFFGHVKTAVSGNPAPQTLNTSTASAPCLVIGFINTAYVNTDLSFTTESPAFDAKIDQSLDGSTAWSLNAGYKLYSVGDTPVDHTIDMADNGNHNSVWLGAWEFT